MHVVKKNLLNSLLMAVSTIVLFVECGNAKKIQNAIYEDGFSGDYKPTYRGNCYKDNCGNKRAILPWDLVMKRKEQKYIIKLLITGDPPDTILPPLDSVPEETQSKLRHLIDEFKKLREKIKETDDYGELLKIANDMAELNCKAEVFKRVRTKKSESDYSFKTGSAELTLYGKRDVEIFINNLRKEVTNWKNNVRCEKVFKYDVFVAFVDIKGYADLQGSKDPMKRRKNNLELSRLRAEAVRDEILNLTRYESSIRFILNTYGKGENLPPGVSDNGKKDDPRRRVSIMTGIVGPKVLIDGP